MKGTSPFYARVEAMAFPVRNLPVIQNWDCHVCGSCCKEYVVTLSEDERKRIESQGWEGDPTLGGRSWFKKRGPWWRRKYQLNHREDGSCVFLSEEGRCRIHERFGYETKPLPCRLFPFVLVPAGDHWRVGMRFACPSAAANKGRNLLEHDGAIRKFATELARREGFEDAPEGARILPPALQAGQGVEWPDLLRFMQALLGILRNREDRMERRLRKCVALANLCKQSKFDAVTGGRLGEFLGVIAKGLDSDVPVDPADVARPGRIGLLLFRQAIAQFTRQDHGPNRGLARRGRVALLIAALRFARGKGPVPRLHALIPETTFDKVEDSSSPHSPEIEEVLERYYTIKVESFQFCGANNFNLPFWEGLQMLLLTFPIIQWVARACADVPPTEAVMRALTIVDDHFGFDRTLRTRRQRISFGILSEANELQRLIAWYGR